MVYSFSRAAITKYHKLGSLKQLEFILCQIRRCGQGNTPSEAPGEEYSLASSSFWWLLALFDVLGL